MKKFARIVVVAVMLLMCFTLCACGTKYTSRYSATLMVRSNTSDKAAVSFGSFSGTYVIKLKSDNANKAFISYKATLKDGNMKVYYDFDGEKRNLFDIGTGGSVDGETETFTGNKTIYIMIQSDGKCGDGSFSFVLEKSEE